jgi:hypothetical protein
MSTRYVTRLRGCARTRSRIKERPYCPEERFVVTTRMMVALTMLGPLLALPPVGTAGAASTSGPAPDTYTARRAHVPLNGASASGAEGVLTLTLQATTAQVTEDVHALAAIFSEPALPAPPASSGLEKGNVSNCSRGASTPNKTAGPAPTAAAASHSTAASLCRRSAGTSTSRGCGVMVTLNEQLAMAFPRSAPPPATEAPRPPRRLRVHE